MHESMPQERAEAGTGLDRSEKNAERLALEPPGIEFLHANRHRRKIIIVAVPVDTFDQVINRAVQRFARGLAALFDKLLDVVERPGLRTAQARADAVGAQAQVVEPGKFGEIGFGSRLFGRCFARLAGEGFVEGRLQDGLELRVPAVGPAVRFAHFLDAVAFHRVGHQPPHIGLIFRAECAHAFGDSPLQIDAGFCQAQLARFAFGVAGACRQTHQVEGIEVAIVQVVAANVARLDKPAVDDTLFLVVERVRVDGFRVLREPSGRFLLEFGGVSLVARPEGEASTLQGFIAGGFVKVGERRVAPVDKERFHLDETGFELLHEVLNGDRLVVRHGK